MRKLIAAVSVVFLMITFYGCKGGGGQTKLNPPSVPGVPTPTVATQAAKAYTCPMHPEVYSENPGDKCPRCGMNLVERK